MKTNTRKPIASASHSDRRNPIVIEPLEGRIAPAASVTVTLSAGLATGGDLDGDGVPDPGDTLHYVVTVQNTSGGSLSGMSFTELLNDANLALVAGSINVSPLAIDESFTAVGNTLLRVGGAAGAGPELFVAGGSVTSNDFEFLGDASTISAFDATSANGGTVNVAADGSFTYLSAVGFTGSDTFTYTLRDDGIDGVAGNADDLTGTATVTITVANKVWFVDNSYAGANGASDGRSTRPFTSLAPLNIGGDPDGAGDILYVQNGTGAAYTGGIALEASQTLHGQGDALIVGGFTLKTAGTAPTLSNVGGTAVALSTGNTLKGLTIGDSNTDISGTSFGTLTVSNVTLNGTGAPLSLSTGTLAATFNSISTTSVTGSALSLTSVGGTLDVTNTTALSGVSVDGILVSGGAVAITLPTLNLSGITGAGVSLSNHTGSFTVTSGTFGTIGGDDIYVSGGTGTIAIGANITNTAGHSVSIDNHETNNITISGAISDTGTGILVQNSNSGTIAFTSGTKTLNTGTNAAVTLTGNTGGTINFTGGGLAITTSSGTGFNATGGGTISVTGTGNTIDATSGIGLNIANTTIGASNLTFQRISSGGGANVGISLVSTGASGGLTVTGVDGGDAGADADAGTGGTIANKTGADGSTTAGIGIFLSDTRNVSLAGMQLNDHQNFAIRGLNVVGFTMDASVINGTNGTSSATDDSAVYFTELTGSASITDSTIANGFEFLVYVVNTGGTLNRLTIDNTTINGNNTANGDDALHLEAFNAAVMNVTVTNSTFTSARGDVVNVNGGNTSSIDFVFRGNAVSNNHANILSGGGGVTISSGGAGSNSTLSYDIAHNTFRDAKGIALNLFRGSGAGTMSGTVLENQFGVAGVLLSGSSQASAISLDALGSSTHTALIKGNIIREYNEAGIIARANAGSSTMNLTVIGNTSDAPPSAGAGVFAFAALFAEVGALPTDTNILNLKVGGAGAEQNNFVDGDPFDFGDVFYSRIAGAGTQFNLSRGVSGSSDPVVITQANNVAPLTVSPAGTITPVNTVPTLPPAVAPLLFAPGADDVAVPPAAVVDQPVTPVTQPPVIGDVTPPVQPPVIVDDGILSQAELDSLVGAAIARWEAAGLTAEQSALLHSVSFSVNNLPGWYLGQAGNGGFTLDTDAAGNGWFVDSTPLDDAEYANGRATLNGGAAGRVDALTTVMHELGHVLGLDDSYASADASDLMYGFLSLGGRRLPVAHQADGAVPHAGDGLDFLFGSMSLGAAVMPAGKSLTIVYDATINPALSNGLAPTVSSQVSFISSAGTVNSNTVATALDTLTLGNLVWNDTSRDGLFNGVEAGVDGVVMNLYADNGTTAGSFDAGDTFVATTTTAGGGLYSFTGLLPGEYIVQAAQSNFNAGGALVALPLSSPGQPDPDNNTDNDDNGAILAGSGAVSQAITLAYNTEITAGTGNDTNSTLDFGFMSQVADLQITKTDGVASKVPGTATTYTIVVTNAGPNDVTGATVADTFAAAFVGATWTASTTGGATGFTASGSGNIGDTVTMPNGSTITYVVTGTIAAGATGSLVNTATVTAPAAVTDPTPGNNSATDTDTLTPQGDLSITKTDGLATEIPGTSAGYTIVVTNAGPSNVTGATIADIFPAIFTGATFTVTQAGGASGFANGSGDINQVVNMPAGSTITYTVSGNISGSATGTLDNTATVTAPGSFTDTNAANNSATDSDTLTPQTDVAVTKTDGVATAVPGTTTTYTIVVSNSGPSTATTTTLSDIFPASITSATWTSLAAGGATGNTASSSGNIAETLTLPSGSTVTYTVTAAIAAGATGTLVNTATVSQASDTNGGNNSATDTDTLTPQADLTITKTDGTATEIPGTGATYTIVVTNSGPSSVTGATVADTFPAIFTGATWTAAFAGGATGTASGSGDISQLVNLPSGGSATYTVTGTISATATGVLVNTATVSAPGGVTDPTPGNNSATDTDTLTPTGDLTITKTDGTASALPGASTTYTIVVGNSGPSTVTGATVADTFPAAFSSVTWTAAFAGGATGTSSGSGDINQLVTVPTGGTVTYTATGTILGTATGSLSNTATVTAPGGFTDPTPGNNSATDTDTLTPQADLAITKLDTPDPVIPGGALTYTIVVSNSGPSTATGATFTDTFPAGFTGATWTAVFAGGASGTASGSGNISQSITVPSGGTATYTVTGTAAAGAAGTTLTNTATISSAIDTNAGNDSATATTFVGGTDLTLTKSDGAASTTTASTITYVLTYQNAGFVAASGVFITETLPTGTSIVLAENPGWAQIGATNQYRFNVSGTIAVGAPASTVNFVVHTDTVAAAGLASIFNTAAIADDGTSGGDITPANNTATDTDTLNAAPDFALTKSDGATTTVPGAVIAYTLGYANSGNQNATGVVLTETLPAGATFNAGASTAGWTAQGGGVFTLAVGALAGGGANGTATFAVNVTNPAAAGLSTIGNTASIADDAANGADATPGNNSATDTDTLNAAPDLTLTKTDGVTATTPGSTLSYVLTYANAGNQGATGVVLTETLPAGTAFNAGASTAGWVAQGGGVFTLAVGALAGGANGSATFAVNVTNPAATGQTSIADTASIADDGSNGADTNTANNTATDTDTLNAAPDFTITKTDGTATAQPGDTLTYTINYANNGDQGATGVVLTDTLPAGTTFVVGENAGWSLAGSTLTFTVGALAGGGANGSATLILHVASPAAAGLDTIDNTIAIADDGANGADSNTANNSATDTDTLDATPDLTLTKTDGVTFTTTGSTLTYTLDYANAGDQSATGVVLTETLPTGTTFNSAASTAGWTETVAGSGIFTLAVGALAGGGGSGSATFAVNVTSPAAAGLDSIFDTASIADDSANGKDATPANNTATDTDTLDAAPDLTISIADNPTQTKKGGTVAYTITYANTGNQDATNVAITETVPANSTFNAAASNPGWSQTGPGTYEFDIASLPAGAAAGSVIFAVDVNAVLPAGFTQLSNTATITDDGKNGADTTAADNTDTETTPIYQGIYVVSPGVALPTKFAPPNIRVFDPGTGSELFSFAAYESTYRDSIRVAVGDMNGDGYDDIITTVAKGTGRLRVFDGLTGAQFNTGPFGSEIAVFDGKKDKGAFVAAGDVTGDGRDDIIVGSALGGGKLRVFDGVTGLQISDTQPFGKIFRGGVRVAVGDVNGDGIGDIIAGQGYYGASVKVFSGATTTVLHDFKVGVKSFRGGVSVAAGDLDGDGKADIIVGRNSGKPTQVEVFSGLNHLALGGPILPFDVNPAKPKYALGVRVAVVDVNFDGIADIITAAGGKGASQVKIYDGVTHTEIAGRSFTAYAAFPDSGLFVAGSSQVP